MEGNPESQENLWESKTVGQICLKWVSSCLVLAIFRTMFTDQLFISVAMLWGAHFKQLILERVLFWDFGKNRWSSCKLNCEAVVIYKTVLYFRLMKETGQQPCSWKLYESDRTVITSGPDISCLLNSAFETQLIVERLLYKNSISL